jgi:hypothetical protein
MIDVLLDSFKHEARQVRVVIDKAKMANLDFTPNEGMRSLVALVNHLSQIPTLDPAMYSSELASGEAVQKKEMELHCVDVKDALRVFDEGVNRTEKRFNKMSEKELLEKNLRPFYESGDAKNWAYYIPEMTRHLAMHKMQLWMYLKLSGLSVDMMTYYGVTTE